MTCFETQNENVSDNFVHICFIVPIGIYFLKILEFNKYTEALHVCQYTYIFNSKKTSLLKHKADIQI